MSSIVDFLNSKTSSQESEKQSLDDRQMSHSHSILLLMLTPIQNDIGVRKNLGFAV